MDKKLNIVISARDEASKTLSSIGSQFSSLAKDAQVGSAVILGSMGLVAKSMINLGSDFQSARVSFETFLGSGEAAGKLLKDLSDFAVKTPFDLPQVVDGTKRLLAYGVAQKSIIPTFRMLGDLSSGNKVRLDQLTLAYGQVKAATRLTGAELRQFTEAGVPMLEVLGKQMGKTTGEIKDMISDNAISFDMTDAALKSLTSEGGRFFKNMESQSKTFGGVMSNVRDEFVRFAISVLGFTEQGEVRQGSIFYYLQIGAERLLGALQAIRPIAVQFFDTVLKNKTAVIAMFGVLLGLMTPLVIAFTAMIAPALLFAAAGGLIAAAISFVIQNFQALQPYLLFIGTFLTLLAVTYIPPVVAAFVVWATTAITAAAATVIALLPILIPIALISAAVVALYYAWNSNFMKIRDITNAVYTWFKTNVAPYFETWFGKIVIKLLDGMVGGWISGFMAMKNAVESLIGAMNSLMNKAKDMGGKGMKLPGFQHGGFVPGAFNEAVPAILHGGERIVPRNGVDVNGGGGGGGSGMQLTLNFTGPVSMKSEADVKSLADQIINIIGRQSELASKGIGF